MYLTMQANIFQDEGIIENPTLPDRVSFIRGKFIEHSFDAPLRYRTNCAAAETPPLDYFSGHGPICSEKMLNAFKAVGVNNFQIFPIVLISEDGSCEWDGYYALNILGRLASCHVNDPESINIAACEARYRGPKNFIVNKNALQNLLLFRVVRSHQVIIKEEVLKNMVPYAPDRGWGISAFPLEDK